MDTRPVLEKLLSQATLAGWLGVAKPSTTSSRCMSCVPFCRSASEEYLKLHSIAGDTPFHTNLVKKILLQTPYFSQLPTWHFLFCKVTKKLFSSCYSVWILSQPLRGTKPMKLKQMRLLRTKKLLKNVQHSIHHIVTSEIVLFSDQHFQ